MVLGLWCCLPSLSILEFLALISFQTLGLAMGHPILPSHHQIWWMAFVLISGSSFWLEFTMSQPAFCYWIRLLLFRVRPWPTFLSTLSKLTSFDGLKPFCAQVGSVLIYVLPFLIAHFLPNMFIHPHSHIVVSVSGFFCGNEVLVGQFIAVRCFCHRKGYFKLNIKISVINFIH